MAERMKTVVVDFFGPPYAGKWRFLRAIKRELDPSGLSMMLILDQIWMVPPDITDETEKSKWAIRETANLVVENEGKYDLILIERGGCAYLASLLAHFRNGKTIRSEKQKREAESALQLARDLIKYENFFILINISPDASEKRDGESGVTRPGKIVNPQFLSLLQDAYNCVLEEEMPRERVPRSRVRIINGENDREKNLRRLVGILLSLIPDERKKELGLKGGIYGNNGKKEDNPGTK